MKNDGPVVDERGFQELGAELALRRTTAIALVQAYLRRIARIDRRGPRLRSVIELNPDARKIARGLDAEQHAGRVRGPLHGMPVLIKDNIGTHDRMATTAGSPALVGATPADDAVVVQRLRAAGAVILGKTNLSEWANARGSGSSAGWSGRGGLTRNPYALDRSASGSSSGSAAAVAASLCAAAIGTETDGSILSPSAVCGIVGLKPTTGRISRRGIVPLAHSQDTAGPMARNVRDCAMLLGVLADPDPQGALGHSLLHDFGAALNADALRGARLGMMLPFFDTPVGVGAVYASALQALKRAGAVLVDALPLPDLALLRMHERTVMLHELKAGLGAYLARLPPCAPVHSLAEVIAFNRRHASTAMAWFGQDRLEAALASGALTDSAYLSARAVCLQLARDDGIDGLLQRHRLDALIAPTTGPAWCIDLVHGDPPIAHSASLAAVAGTPGITVPAGDLHGLPLGLCFYGAAWSEPRLLDLAFAFEQATLCRRPPRYLKHIDTTMPHLP